MGSVLIGNKAFIKTEYEGSEKVMGGGIGRRAICAAGIYARPSGGAAEGDSRQVEKIESHTLAGNALRERGAPDCGQHPIFDVKPPYTLRLLSLEELVSKGASSLSPSSTQTRCAS